MEEEDEQYRGQGEENAPTHASQTKAEALPIQATSLVTIFCVAACGSFLAGPRPNSSPLPGGR